MITEKVVIPYNTDFSKLKQKAQATSTAPVNKFNYTNNVYSVPTAGSEFYESLSNEIDLQLEMIVGNQQMICEGDYIQEIKDKVSFMIQRYIQKYRQFVNESFVDYYRANHSIGYYAQLLGQGWIFECIKNCI